MTQTQRVGLVPKDRRAAAGCPALAVKLSFLVHPPLCSRVITLFTALLAAIGTFEANITNTTKNLVRIPQCVGDRSN